ncbi:hypothetical protein PR202_ga21260 [Eleusine coracana subsp. coracana]|uniref:Alpha/beta hydrolase fold-3 domain-containing protein n=1 Tax=Eleusine coracana subsp. coracana TaxID=191504 RepID=A0AAV5CZ81_ELECO|nr:hypothetical protein QOZ80_8AG0634330 [Eleusine coracana subsp. coracana]GJN03782.1 hypothetical protein PR202_ga21260 [Eleusine coracana subsp. coracana]
MAAFAPAAPPPASADDEIVYESMPCIRIYKNRVERYFGSEFVAASTDAATGVASRDVTISPNVSARLYLPRLDAADGEEKQKKKLPVFVYYHGGGFCLGSAFNPTFHAYFNSFAALANVLVVSVEYRLAPEHPVPAAYADAWEALAWVVSHATGSGEDPWLAGHADFSRLYLGGESAGSNIAHHTAMRAGAESLGGAEIRGLVMIHPYFLGSGKVPSDDLDPAARESLGSLWRVMCPATSGEDDPLINPLVDGAPALDGLACGRVLVCIGEGDVLRDRGRAYYDRLRASGWRGEAEIWQAPDKGHTFHLLEPCCDEAVAQDKVISEFLNR